MTNNPHHIHQHNLITPETAGWTYLSFEIVGLRAGETWELAAEGNEYALVPLRGRANISTDELAAQIARRDVFDEMPRVVYVPPRDSLKVRAETDFEYAVGGAPASGKYPARVFEPREMKRELRGGGAARRQVNHILQYPLPAERLILFEVYVPGGTWAGWPPHCHDRYQGSPYLEEVYYYRIAPTNGFAIHRNYRRDTDFDECFVVRDGDTVLVTQGFHPVAAAPGSNVYFLNYLAGELVDEQRAAPPLDDADFAWMKNEWDGKRIGLPLFGD